MSTEDGASVATAEGSPARNLDARIVAQEMLGRFGVLLGLIVLIIVFSLLSPIFLSQGNITNILIQSSTNAIIAAGMTFVILSANIDLSVGSILALSSVLGTAFIACGMAASSITENQILSAVLTYAVLVLSWFLTWNEAIASEPVMRALLYVSLFDRFYGFASGVIHTRDIAFFLLFTGFFLFLTLRVLQSRSWRGVW